MTAKSALTLVSTRPDEPPRQSLRVLVADDDRDGAEVLAAVVREDGHEVVVALRGDEALGLCRLFRQDVVIADLNMPGASGYALARDLRERHGNSAPLLIAISGVWTHSSDRSLGEAVGFDHYFIKPYDVKTILSLLEPLRGSSGQVGTPRAA